MPLAWVVLPVVIASPIYNITVVDVAMLVILLPLVYWSLTFQVLYDDGHLRLVKLTIPPIAIYTIGLGIN